MIVYILIFFNNEALIKYKNNALKFTGFIL